MSLKRFLLWITALATILVCLVAYFKRTVFAGGFYGSSDFFKFYESALFYFSGQNIYSNDIVEMKSHLITSWVTSDGNLNPPFFTLLLLPLHVFNYAKAYQYWNIFSAACFIASVHIALRPFPQWHKNSLIILALFLLYLPTSAVFAYGQVTGVLLLLLASAWVLARTRYDASAGMFIGLACAVKLFCGLFLIYFLCLKRYRIVTAAMGIIVATSLVGLMVFGWPAYIAYHSTLDSIGWYAASWNISFHGFFTRLFSGAEKNIPVISAPFMANGLTGFCSLVLMGYLIYTWRKWGEARFDLGYALVIVAMLLLSPLGWVYYFPLLLIPYFVMISEGNGLVHLCLCVLLFCSTLTGCLLRTPQIKTPVQVWVFGGMGFYVLLGVLLLLSIVGYRRWHACDKRHVIPDALWYVIYPIIFVPSLIALGAIFRGLANGFSGGTS